MKVVVVGDSGKQSEVTLDKVTINGSPLSVYLDKLNKHEELIKKLKSTFENIVKTQKEDFDKELIKQKTQYDKMIAERDNRELELEQRFLRIWRSIK